MRTLLILVKKDLANFARDKTAVSLTFIVPLALIYIWGFVFGLRGGRDDGPRGVRLAVVNQSDHPGAQKLVDALKAEKGFRVVTNRVNADKSQRPLTEDDLRPLIRAGEFRFAIVIPRDVIRDDSLGLRVKIYSNPLNEIETQTVNGLLQKNIFASTPELLGQSLQAQARRALGGAEFTKFNRSMADAIANAFGGDRDAIQRSFESGNFGFGSGTGLPTRGSAASDNTGQETRATPSTSANNLMASLVKFDSVQVGGENVANPAATRVVGGWAIMFLLFALSGSASAFFDEKKSGIFQRLLAAPVRRSHLLWSKFLWGVLLGLVQLVVLFIGGWAMYGIDVFGHFGNLIVISFATAAACTAFGMLLVAFSPTAAAASGLATFLVLTMSAIGGAWFPVSMMPDFIQQIAKFTLVYWAMEGFAQVLWAGRSLLDILPTAGILLAIAGVVMAAAMWRFNRGRLFE